ncbi:MAG: efflux RND transporter periplasmic adaptor subunit [Gammaproteobacteria bacterium]|nr:efflux RND transporter periplasmic adaptor subunit [Gammaproteobacteria bacterium]MCW8988519.1 efflux RND transporter periplasmic adaptor subunit [Gammaproteobacteria bacterium]MCW9030463.1 efflux RND transporter periplasmic adaptor subunit [Gammaproteobacteria bacterium]
MMPPPSENTEEKPSSWSLENEADIWRKFVTPENDGEFYQTWLALLCRQLPGIKAGAVLLRSEEANTFKPVAIWPEVSRDLTFLTEVAERAITEMRGVAHRPDNSPNSNVQVSYPIKIFQQILGSVVLEAEARSDTEIQSLLRQLHWGIAWIYELAHRHNNAASEAKIQRIGSVMEVIATSLRQNRLQQTLFDLTNHIARQLDCSRVAIGLVNKNSLRLSALSNAAWFEKKTNIVKLYVSAMEETYDQLDSFSYSSNKSNKEDQNKVIDYSAHGRLANESGAEHIYSVPMLLGADCVAILMLERDEDSNFHEQDKLWLDALISLLPAIIQEKRQAERSFYSHIRDEFQKISKKLLGPKYLIWKFSSSLLLIFFLTLTFVHIDYRVSAKTMIEGQIQRAIVVPFEGFVASSNVRAGDLVKQKQVLVTLDDNDLKLDLAKWKSELEQHNRKLREAMAKHDLSEYQVLNAKQQQARAQLNLAKEKLSRTEITAPFDGVVISGDLSQLIGSPVEQGKKLFEIAPLDSYRIILQTDERDIRHIQVGQNGKLVMPGLGEDPIPFEVIRVTPIAIAQDGQNFFRVEALVKNAKPQLRPGMEGVGKIVIGERRIWWVLTHKFTDWLRLSMWKWLP